MATTTLEDRNAMRESLSRYLDANSDWAALRAGFASPRGYVDQIWSNFASMGLLGCQLAPKFGGVDAGMLDVVAIAEQIGKRLIPIPYVNTGVVGLELLSLACAVNALPKTIIEQIVAGSKVVAIAGAGPCVPYEDESCVMKVIDSPTGVTLTGKVKFVPQGGFADYYVLCLKTGLGLEIFFIESSPAVLTQVMQTNDPAQRLAEIDFNDVPAIRLNYQPNTLKSVQSKAIVAAAAEQLGATRAIFDLTLEYLRTRYQFGRPIGSFQAMKHLAAELYLNLEHAASAVYAAAELLEEGGDQAHRCAALACFTMKDTFREITAHSIQMHGGIAYTQEHVAHLFWRRARSAITLFGRPQYHRENYLQSYEVL